MTTCYGANGWSRQISTAVPAVSASFIIPKCRERGCCFEFPAGSKSVHRTSVGVKMKDLLGALRERFLCAETLLEFSARDTPSRNCVHSSSRLSETLVISRRIAGNSTTHVRRSHLVTCGRGTSHQGDECPTHSPPHSDTRATRSLTADRH